MPLPRHAPAGQDPKRRSRCGLGIVPTIGDRSSLASSHYRSVLGLSARFQGKGRGMTDSTALEAIEAQRQKNFRHLRQNGIDPKALDAFESFLQDPATLERESLVLRCRFSNGAIHSRVVVQREKSQRRLRTQLEPGLRRIAPRVSGEADVFILVSDTINVAESRRREFVSFLNTVPFLQCDWLDGDDLGEHAIIMPDFRLLADSYVDDFDAVRSAAGRTPYEDRAEVIGWRGRLSGPTYPDVNNCEIFPRYHLFKEAAQHRDIVDVRVTDFTNFPDTDAAQALRRQVEAMVGPAAPELRHDEFVRYRYLLSVDGVLAPWKTVAMRMATGSVVLMQRRWNQYFTVALTPWRHYVPLRDDFSDLAERYAWLREHPSEARKIALAGQAFVAEAMTPRAIDDYFVAVLESCSEIASRRA